MITNSGKPAGVNGQDLSDGCCGRAKIDAAGEKDGCRGRKRQAQTWAWNSPTNGQPSCACSTRVATTSFAVSTLPLSSLSPMATPSGHLWVCTECGKVCKSAGGLMKHAFTHKWHSHVGRFGGNFHCTYHPALNGTSSVLASSQRF